MKKQMIGLVLGGCTLFLWGIVSWMILPFHNATMKSMPQEQLITDTLKTVVKESGMYFFPNDKTVDGRLSQNEWAEKYQKGPVGMMVFSPKGMAVMGAKQFVVSFLGDLLISFLTLGILILTRERVAKTLSRVKLVAGLGVLVWVTAHLPYWNWFHFPFDYTLVVLFDTVVGFALLGWVLSKFVPKGVDQ